MQNPRRLLSPRFSQGLPDSDRVAVLSSLPLSGRSGRPATPVSICLKFLAPGLLTALLWLQMWLGLSGALALTAAVAVGLIAVQKTYPGRKSGDGWLSQAGYGERIWLNRFIVPIPPELYTGITLLYPVFWSGALAALLGGYSMSALLTATGLLVAHSAQFVCIEKQIRLYREMKNKAPLYRFWASVPDNDNRRSQKATT
ncbi:DUF6653 family protein [Roseibium aggregatum]|uniref:Uncharacterized protein n=1 Tax=Roseibium aggregatum TaxID=187304 RepID=A0A939EDX0_9HYPH|nr:DUF6653 family protein [Roseibium aggregatum]MBN9670328.1 hypothetical protein [Roseibium aggregatum]